MSGCWMAVMLALFLWTPDTVDSFTPNTLAIIESRIVGTYGTTGMFSVAACMTNPDARGQNLNNILNDVITTDLQANVRNSYNSNQVYTGRRVVAAKVRSTDHAEFRVLNNLSRLTGCNANDFLFFYVYAAPCVERCLSNGHEASILTMITAIRRFGSYAVVFSRTFVANSGYTNTVLERTQGLQRLGGSVGLGNIYRCEKNGRLVTCQSCSNGGNVANYCVAG